MDAKLKLFSDLCSILDVKKKKDLNRLLKILKKYHINKINNTVSFKDALDEYIKSKSIEGINKSTLNHYEDVINAFGKIFKYKPINEFTKDDIKYALKVKEDQVQPQTVYTFYSINKVFFEWLMDEKLIIENPFIGVKYKHVKSQRTYIQKDDIKKIKKSCTNLFEKLIIEFLLSTGCRLSEIPKIKLTDCNFSNNTCIVTGKGNKTRTVIFNEVTKKLLKQNIKLSSDNIHLICLNNKQIKNGDITKVVKNTAKRASIKYNICPHMYRHTFATNCLNNGMDITSIQKLLGHSDISTTQIYAETNLENVKSEYRRVFKNELWSKTLLWTYIRI